MVDPTLQSVSNETFPLRRERSGSVSAVHSSAGVVRI